MRWLERGLDRWKDKLKKQPAGGMLVLFLSSTVGLPPFYALSLLAGGVGIRFLRFAAVGAFGRFLRYYAVLFASGFIRELAVGRAYPASNAAQAATAAA